MYRNDLKGNKNYFEFAGGSGYRAFELPEGKITGNEVNLSKKIQGKSILVRVSARLSERGFGLSGVDCDFSSVRVIL